MKLNYALKPKDESRTVKAMVRDINMSPKHAMAVASKVKGMTVSSAIDLLEDVLVLKRHIPFTRHNTGMSHRKGSNQEKVGAYPVKASRHVLDLLRNLQANASYKGLDPEKLKVIHIEAQRGLHRMRRKPKGRWKSWRTQFVHVQAVAKET